MLMKYEKLNNICDVINREVNKLYKEDLSSDDFKSLSMISSLLTELKGRLEKDEI